MVIANMPVRRGKRLRIRESCQAGVWAGFRQVGHVTTAVRLQRGFCASRIRRLLSKEKRDGFAPSLAESVSQSPGLFGLGFAFLLAAALAATGCGHLLVFLILLGREDFLHLL